MKTKMLPEYDFLKGITKLFAYNNVVSISGESGTGKTTLALHIVGNCLEDEEQCIWIQASELFPIKRLSQLFKNYPERLDFLRENIFIIPKNHVIRTYEEQCNLLREFIAETTILPPNLRFIVVDNVSHHLRYAISKYNDIKCSSRVLNDFYEYQIMPLMLFCKRNNHILFLIHEITYVPSLSCSRPFFYKLYDRLQNIDIVLKKSIYNNKKNIHVQLNNSKWEFPYTIENNAIVFH